MRNSIIALSLVLLSPLLQAQQAAASTVQLTESRLSYEVPTLDVPATVYSSNNTELTSGVDGRLHWVAEAGTLVQVGDIVAQLDPTPLQLQRAELAAQLRTQTSAYQV